MHNSTLRVWLQLKHTLSFIESKEDWTLGLLNSSKTSTLFSSSAFTRCSMVKSACVIRRVLRCESVSSSGNCWGRTNLCFSSIKSSDVLIASWANLLNNSGALSSEKHLTSRSLADRQTWADPSFNEIKRNGNV